MDGATPPQSLIAAMARFLGLLLVAVVSFTYRSTARDTPVELGEEGRLFPSHSITRYTDGAAADMVKDLPGAPPGHVNLFSG